MIFFKEKEKKQKKDPMQFYQEYLRSPYHYWISQNPKIYRAFILFLSDFPLELFEQKQIYFVGMHDPFACSIKIASPGHIVTLQPQLIKLLLSADPQYAFAILAHELGHIFLGHSEKNISTQAAQLEADEFACQMGYTRELLHTLELFKEEWACVERIQNIQRRMRNSESSLISSRILAASS